MLHWQASAPPQVYKPAPPPSLSATSMTSPKFRWAYCGLLRHRQTEERHLCRFVSTCCSKEEASLSSWRTLAGNFRPQVSQMAPGRELFSPDTQKHTTIQQHKSTDTSLKSQNSKRKLIPKFLHSYGWPMMGDSLSHLEMTTLCQRPFWPPHHSSGPLNIWSLTKIQKQDQEKPKEEQESTLRFFQSL